MVFLENVELSFKCRTRRSPPVSVELLERVVALVTLVSRLRVESIDVLGKARGRGEWRGIAVPWPPRHGQPMQEGDDRRRRRGKGPRRRGQGCSLSTT
jgi:hypothetical protein